MPLAAVAHVPVRPGDPEAADRSAAARSRTPADFENATLIVFFGVLLILQSGRAAAVDRRLPEHQLPDGAGATSARSRSPRNRLVVLAVALALSALMFVADAAHDARQGDPRRQPGPRHREADGHRRQADRPDRLRPRLGDRGRRRLPGEHDLCRSRRRSGCCSPSRPSPSWSSAGWATSSASARRAVARHPRVVRELPDRRRVQGLRPATSC